MKKIKATIVMVTYNCVNVVENAIQSIISQDYNDIELIIVDGGSTDGTLDRLHRHDEYIAALVSEPDNGIYDAMNKGIRLATGDIIGFLGSDDVYLPGAVSAVVHGFEKSGADLVYGNVIYHRVNGYEHFDYGKLDFDRYVYGNILCHQSFFVRTSIQKDMPFDLSYKLAADYKFHMTLYFSGYRFYYIDKDIAIYSCLGNSGSHPYWTIREFRHVVDEMLGRFPQLKKFSEDIRRSRQNYDFLLLEKHLFYKFSKLGHKIVVNPSRKLILFGTGKMGQECLEIFNKYIDFGQVLCFWDNDINKQGDKIEGIPIKKPLTNHKEQLIVVVTNLYDREICQQLNEAGLIRGEDYWGWKDLVKNLLILYWQGWLGRSGKRHILQREVRYNDEGNTFLVCNIIHE